MTDRSPPMMPMRSAVVSGRRALVVAVVALLTALVSLVVAFGRSPEPDTAQSAAPSPTQEELAAAQAEVTAARVESQEAVASANEAAVVAADAASAASAVDQALAAAVAANVDPAVVAELQEQLRALEALVATALVDADAAAAADGPTEADAASGESEPPEEAPSSDAPGSDDAPVLEDAPVAEDTETVELPGEPSELGPTAGAGLAVVGIAADSALNLRDVPNGQVVARLDNVMDGVRDDAVYVRAPNSDDILTTVDLQRGVVATGNTRRLSTSTWHEMRVGDLTGWSSAAYLAQVGLTDDATAEVLEMAGEAPVADTMVELAAVATRTLLGDDLQAGIDGPGASIVVSEAPVIFEGLAQATVDVVGLADDSVLGYRLVVFAIPAAEDWTQDDPGPFTLRTVERTVLCHSHRGATEEGLCL